MQSSGWAPHAVDTAQIAITLTGDPREATLTASRALLGVIARSVAEALELVTLPQFRALVVLASTGPMRVGALADRVRANLSTFSRTIDRMEADGWVRRQHSSANRREILILLTEKGEALVARVTDHRRREIEQIVDQLKPDDQQLLARAFALFAAAAGEPLPEDVIILGL